jgi:hypothetical protein
VAVCGGDGDEQDGGGSGDGRRPRWRENEEIVGTN